ncbi:phage tail tape measure protein [Streptomyces virginiae]|uniref:phage tail tape measure protein n=1 Tax=Streptomyces virginiae TaxID=1961 RepID=UPI00365AE409
MSVLLTGVVTPYVSAMRTAARSTTTTARSIESDMRRAALASSMAMTSMARASQAQASRIGSGLGRAAMRASMEMSRLGGRGTLALAAINTAATGAASSLALRLSAAAARASVTLSAVGARGAAAFSVISAAATSAAAAISARFTAAAAAVSARMPAAAARANAALATIRATAAVAFATVSSAASTAAAYTSARWTAAQAVASARWATFTAAASTAMGAVSAGANTAASWVSARWAAAGAAVSARWTAAGVTVSRAMAAASASAGSAASWAAARWAAAGAAVSGAFSSMTLAAYAAGASIMGVANDGRKSLEAMRMASLGLVAVFGLAAFAAAKFEKAMSEVRAVTGGSAKDMKSLSKAALDAGQATIYSATQAANAEAELARAGISTADIIGGALRGALDLAASGQLELGESAIISAQAMNAFKLTGRDVGHIADVISAGAGKSATNVHHMGMAFRQAALLSSQTGLSLEQTVGTLSLFAQNALTGSDAGTSLKVMLQRLVPQSNEARASMEAVGFSAYDASGNFIGLSALAANMKESFSKLTPEARNAAMATIFGSDAVRAATILYEAGAEGVDQWVNAVDDAGYATRVAATMTDNLAGDLERLKGAFETALISSGSSANSVLRDMAQALTSVVNWYSQLSPGVQSSVTVIAGLTGVITLLGSSLLLMLPRIMAVRAELVALGVTAASVRGALMALGRATVVIAVLTAIAAAVSYVTDKMTASPPSTDKMILSLMELGRTGKVTGQALKTFGQDLDKFGEAVARVAHPEMMDRLSDAFWGITHLGTSSDPFLEKARDQLTALDTALTDMVANGAVDEAADSFARFAAEAEKNGTSTEKLRTLLPEYSKALDENAAQAQLTATSQKKLGDASSITADQIADQRTEAEKLKDALSALNGVAISAAEKEISFRASLADLTEAVKENGHSLDVTTEKGRAVKGAFLDAAQAAMAHAQAVTEQSGTIEAGNAILEQDIAVLKRQMLAAGFSTAAVEQLIGAYAKMPTQVVTDIKAETAKAVSDLQNVQAELRNTKGKSVTIDALTAQAEQNLKALGFSVTRLPDGRVTVHIPTGPPSAAIDAIQGRINNITGRTVGVGVYLRATSWDQDANGVPDLIQSRRNGGLVGYAGGGAIRGYPTGGAVRGPGSGTSDSILARVSNGEYVVKAASVRKYGVAMLDQLNSGRAPAGYTARPAGRIGGLGGGQPVQQITKQYTINLYGSQLSSAEQAAEIQRRLSHAS